MEEFSIWCRLIAGWFLIPLLCTMGLIQFLFWLVKVFTPPPENTNQTKEVPNEHG